MSNAPKCSTAPASAPLSRAGDVLRGVLCELEAVRVTDRTIASDEERLGWIEQVVEAERGCRR